jgi:hypothetical protein
MKCFNFFSVVIPVTDSEHALLPLQFAIDPGPVFRWGEDEFLCDIISRQVVVAKTSSLFVIYNLFQTVSSRNFLSVKICNFCRIISKNFYCQQLCKHLNFKCCLLFINRNPKPKHFVSSFSGFLSSRHNISAC